MRGERSLHHLLAQLAVSEVGAEVVAALDPEGRSTLNVNTPADWGRAIELAEGERGFDPEAH
jgi:hypothetical protein